MQLLTSGTCAACFLVVSEFCLRGPPDEEPISFGVPRGGDATGSIPGVVGHPEAAATAGPQTGAAAPAPRQAPVSPT